MLTLVSSQRTFDEFVESIDWHDGEFLEYHSLCTDRRGVGSSTLRILIMANFRDVFEFVFYDPNFAHGISGNFLIECTPQAIVKRRQIEFTVGECIGVRAACMAFRNLVDAIEHGSYFGRVQAYDNDFNLITPYNIDWRTMMDEACLRLVNMSQRLAKALQTQSDKQFLKIQFNYIVQSFEE